MIGTRSVSTGEGNNIVKSMRTLISVCMLLISLPANAQKLTVAAAADLRFAMDNIVASFKKANPAAEVAVIYGSSGKFYAQIQQGAPYDMYFSADIDYPRRLAAEGLAAAPVKPYALGRIVLWSSELDATRLTLLSLTAPTITRIAIANPQHAPYGKRAKEALHASGIWQQIEHKLVYGENISHAAQFVDSGSAQVGIIALSLALNPTLVSKGGYWLIPENLHEPLEQGFIVTMRAKQNALAERFADYMSGESARAVMARYGFVLPDQAHEAQPRVPADAATPRR
jgi:molybdate transport system substrate-binding protein